MASDRADEDIIRRLGLGATAMEVAVLVPTELGGFRCVDAPEANAGARVSRWCRRR
jgi:hypothetical protein